MKRSNLLWVDGLAGAVVGIAMFALLGWLSAWYRLPRDLLLLMGVANVSYAVYSLSLASRSKRPMILIQLLVVANILWGVACFRWAILFGDTANALGLLHLVGEGLIVGGMGCIEWRWREDLRTA